MQHETTVRGKNDTRVKKGENTAVVEQIDSLRDDVGRVIKLSSNKAVPHMVEVKGKWKVQMPKDHPMLRVQLEVDVEAYSQFGLEMKLSKRCMTKGGKVLQVPKVSLLCDTGAQVDCVSRAQMRGLGLVEGQLLQPAVTVGCANGTAAHVVGIFFGKVTAMNGADKVQTKVMFYVVRSGGNILSRTTCETLGVIDKDFPRVAKHFDAETQVAAVSSGPVVYQEVGECDPDSELPCRCPRRQYIDPPDKIPYAPVPENRQKLEDWIKDYYVSGAFSARI